MPLHRCQTKGKAGWRWGRQGKCYVGAGGKQRAIRQGVAIEPKWFGLTGNQRKTPNPLRVDPTRTATLRRRFETALHKRFNRLKREIRQLVVVEDAFGLRRYHQTGLVSYSRGNGANLTVHTRFAFLSRPEQVKQFNQWLQTRMQVQVLGTTEEAVEQAYWHQYVQEGYRKGAGRAYDDSRKARQAMATTAEDWSFYVGGKEEFLRSSFARPVAIGKVKLLAGRVFTELQGVNQEMATKISRNLIDGLVQGMNPEDIARRMIKNGIGTKTRGVQSRAARIARTEIIRCHAEGALDALEDLGMDEVGVMTEWSTSGEPCPVCAAMEGTVMKVQEMRGMIPRHPNCACTPIPANVGESTVGQKRSQAEIRKSIDESIRRTMPKGRTVKDPVTGKMARRYKHPQTGRFNVKTKRTLAEQKARTSWAGADTKISKARPRPFVVEKPKP